MCYGPRSHTTPRPPQEACSTALRAFEAGMAKGCSASDCCRKAASALAKSALDRGTRDNVTVIVVDLRVTPQQDDAQ